MRATFAMTVDNAPGVLHRIVGVFASRDYDVDGVTVAETDHVAHASRITIVTRGAPRKLEQIQARAGDRHQPARLRVRGDRRAGTRSTTSKR